MRNLKKILALLMTGIMLVLAAGCGGGSSSNSSSGSGAKAPSNGKRVGVAMPTQSSQRWIQDGANMKQKLEALGYEVDLQYAEDDVQAQVSQIENMITNGATAWWLPQSIPVRWSMRWPRQKPTTFQSLLMIDCLWIPTAFPTMQRSITRA